MGCEDCEGLSHVLSLKHDGAIGIVLSIFSSLVSTVYSVGLIVSISWKIPTMTVRQTRSLMSPNRRMILVSFMLSFMLVDFMSIHAWRFLPGSGACVPTPDWFMLWCMGNILNVVCLVFAWIHPPFSMALIHASIIASAYLVLYYLFSCFAMDRFCGSMFVAVPCVIAGVVNIFAVPESLQIPMEEFVSLGEHVGRAVARITQGPVVGDKDSVSVYLAPREMDLINPAPSSSGRSNRSKRKKRRSRRRNGKGKQRSDPYSDDIEATSSDSLYYKEDESRRKYRTKEDDDPIEKIDFHQYRKGGRLRRSSRHFKKKRKHSLRYSSDSPLVSSSSSDYSSDH